MKDVITRINKLTLDEQAKLGISSDLVDHLSMMPTYLGLLLPSSEQDTNT
jgi:hypothetical protein